MCRRANPDLNKVWGVRNARFGAHGQQSTTKLEATATTIAYAAVLAEMIAHDSPGRFLLHPPPTIRFQACHNTCVAALLR